MVLVFLVLLLVALTRSLIFLLMINCHTNIAINNLILFYVSIMFYFYF